MYLKRLRSERGDVWPPTAACCAAPRLLPTRAAKSDSSTVDCYIGPIHINDNPQKLQIGNAKESCAMAPQTRSRTAPIASFPDPTQPADASRKERSLAPEHELQPLKQQDADNFDRVPPKYTIDLSRPPAERYTEVVADFKPLLLQLPTLFDELVKEFGLPLKAVRRVARLLLRSVHSKEQTAELRGISKASGVDMYLLVCFNTLLDLFMGCSSGAARVKTEHGMRMYHFRTLDWSMDLLRQVVVQLEFVEKPHGPVISRSVTYVGFVGVLTGVREGLSISLNFRPYNNNNGSVRHMLRYCAHQLAVLLGFRPSICSHLREMLIPRTQSNLWKRRKPELPTLGSIKRTFPSVRTSAAYLVFSDGDETTVFEKDRITAVQRSSNSFIAVTNCDVPQDGVTPKMPATRLERIQDLLDEADSRRQVLETQWGNIERRFRRRKPDEAYAQPHDVIKLLMKYPIMNECTHYSVVMDPKAGDIAWARRWPEGEAHNRFHASHREV